MRDASDTSLFPLPKFSDAFRSYFDAVQDSEIGSNVVSYSPLTRNVSSCITTVKVRGQQVKTLNLEDVYRLTSKIANSEEKIDVNRRIYYPSRDVPEATWRDLHLFKVDYNLRDDGMSPLLWAAHIGDKDGMDRLLSFGADVNRQLKNGNTVLMETIIGNSYTRLGCIETLLDHGARVEMENKAGHTAFTAATSSGDVSIVKLLLLRRQEMIDVNHKTKLGTSALMLAIAGNHTEIAQYLLDHDVDLLEEDREHLTAICWAQVLSPSLTGLLILQLGIQNKLIDFMRRRVELLHSRQGTNKKIFGLFYHLTFLLLNFETARQMLINEGTLRKITFHPAWDSLNGGEKEQDKSYYQMLPWFVALGFSMVNSEQSTFKYFVSKGPVELYFEELNDQLGSALDDQEIFIIHAMFIPLFCREVSRQLIIDRGFKYRNILDLFTDLDDALGERTSEIYDCFKKHMDSQLKQYTLKYWRALLGEGKVGAVVGVPKLTVAARVKASYAHFDMLREKAREIKARFEQEDEELRQAREKEMLKVERNRARRTRKRERRRIFFYNARQVAAERDREMHAALKAEEKISKSSENAKHQFTDSSLVKATADRKAMGLSDADLRRNPGAGNHQTTPVCPPKLTNSKTGCNTQVKMKEYEVKISRQVAAKNVPDARRSSPQKISGKVPIEGKKNEKKPIGVNVVKLPSNRVQTSPHKKFELSKVPSPVVNRCKPQDNKSLKAQSPAVNKNKTKENEQIVSKSDVTKSIESKRINTASSITNNNTMKKSQATKIKSGSGNAESIKGLVTDDCNHSADKQSKLNGGGDSSMKKKLNLESGDGTRQVVNNSNLKDEEKYTGGEKTDTNLKELSSQKSAHKCEVAESSSTLPIEQKNEIQSGNTDLNQHNEVQISLYQKSKSESEAALGVSMLPKVPKCAVYAEDLEKQNGTPAHVIKSDQDVLSPVGNKGKKTATVSVSNGVLKSAGDGLDLHKMPGERSDEKREILIPWQKRSSRWSHLFHEFIELPDGKKEKAGALNFSFSEEKLLIAKGSEGTVVSVGIRNDGAEVAVKRMLKTYSRNMFNELKNLRLPELENANVVQYRDYAEDAHFGYLALELCEYTLDEYIVKLQEKNLLQVHSKRLVKELFQGLKILHEANVLHRDLKPRNVLIDIRGTLKLADFGVSTKMSDNESTIYQTSAMGTRCWRPTETLRSLQKGVIVPFRKASDIQVAGMITYFIISGGKHPYGQDAAECEINIRDSKPVALVNEKDDTLLGFLAGTLHFEPSKRRTADQCLLHPYFWSAERKFEFLQKVRKMTEIRQKLPCKMTKILNTAQDWIGCQTWQNDQDSIHMTQMKYHGFFFADTVVDFLCFVVDTDDMFSEMPAHLQAVIGDPRKHFLLKYPRLFMAVFEIVRDSDWKERRLLVDFFQPPKENY